MPSARGIVMDTRAAPPTQDAEEFERQIIPVLTSLFVQYRRCSILVGSRVAVLHSRRLSNSFETVETFMDDLDAAIAYAKS